MREVWPSPSCGRRPFAADVLPEPGVPARYSRSVPDFELTTYDPVAHDFSKFSLAEAKKAGRWTILFFYPADFTFV